MTGNINTHWGNVWGYFRGFAGLGVWGLGVRFRGLGFAVGGLGVWGLGV